MKILLCNDDGYAAEGLGALARMLSADNEVFVSAPHRQRSAASRAMTLFEPIYAERVTVPLAPDCTAYAVTGTPVDCARLGIANLFETPDLVISGINHGANLGTDTLYSGTVGAAAEAALLGLPALASSVSARNTPHYLDAAAEVTCRVALWLAQHPLPFGIVLNLNIPDLPLDAIKGIRTAPLAVVQYALRYEEDIDANGKPCYRSPTWRKESDSTGLEVDDRYVAEGYAVCTPLHYDLTDRTVMADLSLDELLA